ncbi:MAG: hypothetical protein PHQ19_06325 [Candidatus Krumholzibacteria bacterium]|nr:hypothetical protein [Candidatus Krumholzibacteria bacterium]
MNDLFRNTAAALVCVAAIAGAAAGCGELEPFTVLFTGDEHGRLVPYG